MQTPSLPWSLIVPLVIAVGLIAVARSCYSMHRTSSTSLAVPIVGGLALIGAGGAAIAAFSALGEIIGALGSNGLAIALIVGAFLYFGRR